MKFMHRQYCFLIGGVLLLAHGLGCTEGESVSEDRRTPSHARAPASVRLPRSTVPARGEPTPVEPGAPQAADAAPASRDITVEIEADPDIGRTPLTVQFHALVEGGTGPYRYEWDFGDGGKDTQPATTHTYGEPGAYLASLVVSDSEGHSARQEVGVQVDPADNHDVEP